MQKNSSYINAVSFAVFTISFIALYYLSPSLFHYPDVSWHILAGEHITTNGEIPEFNIWSAEENPDPWFNISWLFDVFLSHISSIFGIEALVIIKSALNATILTLVFCNCYKRSVSLESAILATFLVSLVFSISAPIRPQLITFLMIAIFHHILHKNHSLDEPPKLLLSLPILTILWANCHGGFLVGIIMIGAYGIDTIKNKNRKYFFTLLFTGILCVGAIFLTPVGFGIIEGSLKTMSSGAKQVIGEWQPVNLVDDAPQFLFVLILVLSTNIKIKNATIADKILTFFWLFMGLSAYRHFPIFAILAAPYLATCINSFDHEKNDKLISMVNNKKNTKLAFVISFVILTAFVTLSYSILNKKNIMDINPVFVDNGIKEASEYIIKNYPDKKIYNSYSLGGQILYFSKGKIKVFVDGRANTAYNDDIIKSFMTLDQGLPGWEKEISKYNFDLIIANSNERIIQLIKLKGGWEQVYNEKGIIIMIKK